MEFNESKTYKNLYTAFAGETQAHAKYLFFQGVAKKEGYEQIAEIFKYTAENELEHAKLWFKELKKLGQTLENLQAAESGENFEWKEMYKEFAETAEQEGYHRLAKLFKNVGNIEKHHDKRYQTLIDNYIAQKVFKKDEPVLWQCRNCGHIHEGEEAPLVCPVCGHAQAYFQIYPENY